MKKLLIANRGEIARRVIRTAQRMGIETVAVYSDADAQALHVREASCAVALGGNTSAESYLRIDKLIAAAHAAGADAVHPGYGFLSENADFAQAVVDVGLTWVGPPASAIQALGNKSRAKQLALSRGVPCLPGYNGSEDADGQSDERFAHEAQRVGYPLMVKATAGGGGRGMRLVLEESSLMAALHSARSEAVSAFGSGELLLERALLEPRHVEVQVFADQHGHCVHLGERDCSVQRRHQKIIEESPSPAVGAALRERMGRCAVELALAAGYVGAGTVEFLLEADDLSAAGSPQGVGASFYLMEMNTRLQVEHPVTEAVTGLDLVEWQLRVAQGEVLPLIQHQITFTGHAMEVRLCAEDAQYTPHSGTVAHFVEPPVSTRFDHAIYSGMTVTPYYDAMLGKLIAHAPTRQQAIEQLSSALAQTQLLGLPSNRSFLNAILQDAEFQAGQARIPYLMHKAESLRQQLRTDEQGALLVAAVAMYFAWQAHPTEQLACPFAKSLRLQHHDTLHVLSLQELDAGKVELLYKHAEHVGSYQAGLHGQHCVTVDGLQQGVCAVPLAGQRWHVQVAGVDLWLQDNTLTAPSASTGAAGSADVRAKFNGKVIAIQADVGATVKRGDTLLVIESMKLEHAIAATQDGVVASVEVALGQQAITGQILVRLSA
ncbi:MAG: biotin carboxylase N-terminal domain-containing protein [Burkholderiaceae bacterium]